MIIDKFNSIRAGDGMYQSCVLNGSYGLRLCAEAVDAVIDIGANVGFFAVAARMLCPEAQVIALEPHTETFRQLLLNVKHLRVQPVNAGIGTGPIKFRPKASGERGPYGVRFDSDGTGSGIVAGVSLEDILRAFQIEPEGVFIKIDCEGGERHLFEDVASEAIIRASVGIGGEYHTVPNGPSMAEFESWLRSVCHGTHTVEFFQPFRRNQLCEFRAVRHHLPARRQRTLQAETRKVTFTQHVLEARRRKRRKEWNVGESVELPYEKASHSVCCGYCHYSYFQI